MNLPALNFAQPHECILAGAPPGHDARLVHQLALQAGPRGTLVIVQDDVQAALFVEHLRFFAPDLQRYLFPAWDCLPYDRVSPSAGVLAQRAETLTALANRTAQSPYVLVTTVAAAMQLVPPPTVFAQQQWHLQAGATLPREQLAETLVRQGFRRVATVREAGDFSLRGDIVDIFPASSPQPLRLEVFGDTIEHIKVFDAATQLSGADVAGFSLQAVTELQVGAAAVAEFRSRYRALFGAQLAEDPLYQAISDGRTYAGAEHWLPLFYPQLVPLNAYLPRALVVQGWQVLEAAQARSTQVNDFYHARHSLWQAAKKDRAAVYKPVPPTLHYLETSALVAQLAQHSRVALTPFAPASEKEDDGAGRAVPDFAPERQTDAGKLYEHVGARLRQAGTKALLACSSQGVLERMSHALAQHGGVPPNTTLAVLPLEAGFSSPDLYVITEQDILGDRIVRARKGKKRSDEFVLDLGTLQAGDYVVHDEHGIGRFDGLVTLAVAGTEHDCLKIIYAGGDRVFLPVENLDLLSRYGAEDAQVTLDKLGGAGWQSRKARVKKRLRDMAEALLKIAAARALQQAPVLVAPTQLYDEFAARFPYAETEDQARAISSVLADLQAGKPMDRLVCGDVGFGKTEVALRAAFAAASAGFQVAVVVPTTLLARQHAQNFRRRFQGLPITIGQLSRFVSAKEAAETKAGLADGRVDIVIGTHALLAQNVAFARLALVIVDEEQHFGVKHKEKLKDLQKNVHVLTLSATPIPRTLQLALTGVRELSLIATPPVDRLAVRTTVMPYDPLVIREALMREHYRGGQAFYVAPHIEDLATLAEELRALVPELKMQVAHGQMPAAELENIMAAFDDGAFDVLLSTNIVESGLDIPRANTIIIHKAGQFGLAQLYQLRGRVGRAKQRGFAYLTYPNKGLLAASAEQRLKIMETLDQLGAGFQLASHDMDLRGAGNLLGEEQSGHIREVGIELYQQMLKDAVAAAKRGELIDMPETAGWSPTLNLGLSVLIPDSFVADLGTRLTLYRRLAELTTSAELEGFAIELVDRFGSLPHVVQNLLQTMQLKILCRQAGIEKLDLGPNGALITFRNHTFAAPEALLAYIQNSRGKLQVRPDMRVQVLLAAPDVPKRLTDLESVLQTIVGLLS